MISKKILYFLIFILLFSVYSYAQPHPVPHSTRCDECGMLVSPDSKFIAEVVDRKGKKLFFCDIGDMLSHFRTDRDGIMAVYVKDYVSGDWIDGKKSLYVFNKEFKSPMAWNIAAFGKDSDAKKWGSPVDFNGAFGHLK